MMSTMEEVSNNVPMGTWLTNYASRRVTSPPWPSLIKKRKKDQYVTIGSNEVRKNIIFHFLSYRPTLKKHGGHHIYMWKLVLVRYFSKCIAKRNIFKSK
jgi:hypothetical protein